MRKINLIKIDDNNNRKKSIYMFLKLFQAHQLVRSSKISNRFEILK